MAYQDSIQAAIDQEAAAAAEAAARLAEILRHPKPTYTVEGQSVSWTEYQKMLNDIIKGSADAIVALKTAMQVAGPPYEFISRGI